MCGWSGPRFASGARCPVCRSLPRNRLIPFALRHFGLGATGRVVLHVAANEGEQRFIGAQGPSTYIRADLRKTDQFNIVTDLTSLAVQSGVVDLTIAWHVLEHVPDDASAIAEVARSLRPGGAFLMSVPLNPPGRAATEENPSVMPADRELVFGHPDHVRNCGADYGLRLAAAGLQVEKLALVDVDGATQRRLGLSSHHMVWCGRRV